ncbi:MAG: hypothetical protein CMK59_09185 [Proteobacteria bacterium]|nr:hypothetical protein [Pseudomonadota bacterium]
MAKGKQQHKQRLEDLNLLGRELARRSKSRCELCGDQKPLFVTELMPPPVTPDIESALLLCSSCQHLALLPQDNPSLSTTDSLQNYSFFNDAVWSETAPVQIAAIRNIRFLAQKGALWAQDINDSLYVSPEIEDRLS